MGRPKKDPYPKINEPALDQVTTPKRTAKAPRSTKSRTGVKVSNNRLTDYPETFLVIVSKDEREDLVDTIKSALTSNPKNDNFGIIAVDDGDGGDYGLVVSEGLQEKGVIPVFPSPMDYGDLFGVKARDRAEQKMGPNRARNFGTSLLPPTVKYFIFCDAHLKFQTKNWVKKITDHFEKNPKTGIVTCNMNGGKGMFWDTSTFEIVWNVNSSSKVVKTTGCPAGFMAIRADLFKRILGFNPLFHSYGIDEELSCRVWRTGYDIDSLTDLMVDHKFKTKIEFKVDYAQVLAQQYMGASINLPKTTNFRNFILHFREKHGDNFISDVLDRIKSSEMHQYRVHFENNVFTRTEEEFILANEDLRSKNNHTLKIPTNFQMKKEDFTVKNDEHVIIIEHVFNHMNIKLLHPNASIPDVPREGDSGVDLRACLDEVVTIAPMSRVVIPSGIAVQVPVGFEVQIRSRSGLAAKNGIFVLNSPATIDNSYTGELKVILFNTGSSPFEIHHGDRIAQLVVAPYAQVSRIGVVDQFEERSNRGSDGLGSTGVK